MKTVTSENSNSECDDLPAQNTKSDLNRFAATEHKTVQESVPKLKSMTGLSPSRTVTRYEVDSPEAGIDVHETAQTPAPDMTPTSGTDKKSQLSEHAHPFMLVM